MARWNQRPALWGAALAATAFALDQVTKAAALAAAPTLIGRGIEVLPFFNLVLLHNRGVSFGLLASDHPASWWMLILLSAAIIAGLAVWLVRTQYRMQAAALGLVTGGALGNVADRLRHGAVTDFLDFHLWGYHWPAFNFADSAIVIGAMLLLASDVLRAPLREHHPGS